MIPGEVRFIGKRIEGGRLKGRWGVYDRQNASWPRALPGYGELPESVATEKEATELADHLAEHYTKAVAR